MSIIKVETQELLMKVLKWIGSSREDLMEFPDEVIDEMGHGLSIRLSVA
jgi:hypothetical protein